MKLEKVVLVTAICSVSLSVTAFAGTWKTGANENANRCGMITEMEHMPRMVGIGLMEIVME